MQPFLLHRMAHQLPHSLADNVLCPASASHVSTSDGPVLTYQLVTSIRTLPVTPLPVTPYYTLAIRQILNTRYHRA
jgi:hypothetical protein